MQLVAATQSDSIHNTTGDYKITPEVNSKNGDSRSKRSLLPFICQLSKSLFGTATEKDVQMLAGHIPDLIKQANNL